MDGRHRKPEDTSRGNGSPGAFEAVKDFLTAREPGCGYFQGAEGALRFLALIVALALAAAVAYAVT